MEGVVKSSLSNNLNILTMFGLFPPESNTRIKRIRFFLLYFSLTYPVPLLGVLYFILEEQTDPLRTSDNAFLVAQTVCHITKFLPFVINGNRMKKCIDRLEDPIFVARKNGDIEIMKKCSIICRRNSTVFLISVIGTLISWTLKPFLASERQLPVDVWLPFNVTDTTELYVTVYFWLVSGVAYTAIASAAIDTLIGGLACLIAGQFRILKKNLQTLNENGDRNPAQISARGFTLKNRIKACIRHQNAILHFIKEYEHCFSPCVFSQFSGSVFVISFCCVQLSKVSPSTFYFTYTVICLIIVLIEIYFYCYYGTAIYEESNTLTDAVYMGPWYEYDVKSRKELILLMERSKRPIVITAGKVLDLSVITFTSILKKSYSLLAVFNNQ